MRVPIWLSRYPGTTTFLVIFAFLLVLYHGCLRSPPNMDQAKGIWFEGIFLAETNFDFHRLLTHEQGPYRGGAFVYGNSVLPSFIAILLKIGGSDFAIVVYHVFNIACAATILQVMIRLLQPGIGYLPAIAASLAFLTIPEISVQVELAGMEVPMTAFAVWAIYCLTADRSVLACFLATIAALIKFSAFFVPIAMLLYSVCMMVLCVAMGNRRGFRFLISSIGLSAVILLLAILNDLAGMDHLAIRPVCNPIY